MSFASVSLKPFLAALPLLILGSVGDAAMFCAETSTVAARRIQAWSTRR